jgi:hypothetical protein
MKKKKEKREISEEIKNLKLTKKKLAIYEAYEKGYRVIDGQVEYKGKYRKLFSHYKGKYVSPYLSFGVRYNRQRIEIYVHQLLAYQKFGLKYLQSNKDVIYIDKNTRNNQEENIELNNL